MSNKNKCLGGCKEFSERFGISWDCCLSCHEDDDYGYDSMHEEQFDNGYYVICCKIFLEYEKKWKKRLEK